MRQVKRKKSWFNLFTDAGALIKDWRPHPSKKSRSRKSAAYAEPGRWGNWAHVTKYAEKLRRWEPGLRRPAQHSAGLNLGKDILFLSRAENRSSHGKFIFCFEITVGIWKWSCTCSFSDAFHTVDIPQKNIFIPPGHWNSSRKHVSPCSVFFPSD